MSDENLILKDALNQYKELVKEFSKSIMDLTNIQLEEHRFNKFISAL